MSSSLGSHELYSPWTSPGQNTGVGSLSLLQRIFPTQVLNPGLLHCRQILYQLSHCTWGPHILTKVMMGWREEMAFLEFRAPRFPSRSWKQSGPAIGAGGRESEETSWLSPAFQFLTSNGLHPVRRQWIWELENKSRLAGVQPQQDQGVPSGWTASARERERERERKREREREGEREKDQRLGVSSRVRQCFIFYCSFNTLS